MPMTGWEPSDWIALAAVLTSAALGGFSHWHSIQEQKNSATARGEAEKARHDAELATAAGPVMSVIAGLVAPGMLGSEERLRAIQERWFAVREQLGVLTVSYPREEIMG